MRFLFFGDYFWKQKLVLGRLNSNIMEKEGVLGGGVYRKRLG